MSTKQTDPLKPFIGPGAEAFKLWVSFFPTAPLFGVKWRFAEAMPFMGMPAPMTGAAPARKAASKSGTAPSKASAPARPARAAEPAKPAPAPERAKSAPAAEAANPAAKPAEPSAAKPTPTEAAPAPAAKPANDPAPAPVRATEAPESGDRPQPTKPKGLLDSAPATADDLKMIRGIGPGLESKLNALGIYKFDQIAAFSEADLVWVDENLTAFKGRCFRDDWVGQARDLRG